MKLTKQVLKIFKKEGSCWMNRKILTGLATGLFLMGTMVNPVTAHASVTTASVPEPITMLLIGTGIVAVAGIARKIKK